jgi:hypothetical protein
MITLLLLTFAAILTLAALLLLALGGGLIALYVLFPHVRTRIESRLLTDTGQVYEETLTAVDRARGIHAGMAHAPDPRLQPPLFPLTAAGQEAAHG